MTGREEVTSLLAARGARDDSGSVWCPRSDGAHEAGGAPLVVGPDAVPLCQADPPCDPVAVLLWLGMTVADAYRIVTPEDVHEPQVERRQFDDDTDNAHLFAELHGGRLLWVPTRKTWLTWVGTHWREDLGGAPKRYAMRTSRTLWGRASREEDPERAARMMRRAQSAGHRSRIEAMVELGKSLLEVEESELDADPWLLNVLNGTLDLRTGELRDHAPADRITRVAPVEWDPAAASPRWESFLATSIPDQAERDFLRRLAGYCLAGVATEEKFFFVHGPAGSGKSTFVDALSSALGPYAATADPALFLKSQRPAEANRANPALVHLVGRRLAVSTEPPRGKSWDEGLMKRLTGGDAMATRQNYGSQFEFVPQFTLVVVGNSRPPVEDDAGGAMTRRLVEVPFPVPAGESRDDSLKAELRDPARSGAAVLRWAVAGCLEWQAAGGLQIPETVRRATDDYWAEQADNDPVAQFLDEHYERGVPGALAPFQQVHEHLASVPDAPAMTAKALAKRLRELGVEDRKSNGVRCWVGLRRVRVAPAPARTVTWDALLQAAPSPGSEFRP